MEIEYLKKNGSQVFPMMCGLCIYIPPLHVHLQCGYCRSTIYLIPS